MIPMPYRIAAAGVALVLAGGLGYLKGYTAQAGKIAECRATLGQLEQTYAALEEKHEQQRLVSERITQDVSERWAAALDWQRGNSRVVRVRQDCNGTGGEVRVSEAPTGSDETSGESGLGAPGTAAEVVSLTVEQINARLNNAERDAAQLAHLIDWIRQQEANFGSDHH